MTPWMPTRSRMTRGSIVNCSTASVVNFSTSKIPRLRSGIRKNSATAPGILANSATFLEVLNLTKTMTQYRTALTCLSRAARCVSAVKSCHRVACASHGNWGRSDCPHSHSDFSPVLPYRSLDRILVRHALPALYLSDPGLPFHRGSSGQDAVRGFRFPCRQSRLEALAISSVPPCLTATRSTSPDWARGSRISVANRRESRTESRHFKTDFGNPKDAE